MELANGQVEEHDSSSGGNGDGGDGSEHDVQAVRNGQHQRAVRQQAWPRYTYCTWTSFMSESALQPMVAALAGQVEDEPSGVYALPRQSASL